MIKVLTTRRKRWGSMMLTLAVAVLGSCEKSERSTRNLESCQGADCATTPHLPDHEPGTELGPESAEAHEDVLGGPEGALPSVGDGGSSGNRQNPGIGVGTGNQRTPGTGLGNEGGGSGGGGPGGSSRTGNTGTPGTGLGNEGGGSGGGGPGGSSRTGNTGTPGTGLGSEGGGSGGGGPGGSSRTGNTGTPGTRVGNPGGGGSGSSDDPSRRLPPRDPKSPDHGDYGAPLPPNSGGGGNSPSNSTPPGSIPPWAQPQDPLTPPTGINPENPGNTPGSTPGTNSQNPGNTPGLNSERPGNPPGTSSGNKPGLNPEKPGNPPGIGKEREGDPPTRITHHFTETLPPEVPPPTSPSPPPQIPEDRIELVRDSGGKGIAGPSNLPDRGCHAAKNTTLTIGSTQIQQLFWTYAAYGSQVTEPGGEMVALRLDSVMLGGKLLNFTSPIQVIHKGKIAHQLHHLAGVPGGSLYHQGKLIGQLKKIGTTAPLSSPSFKATYLIASSVIFGPSAQDQMIKRRIASIRGHYIVSLGEDYGCFALYRNKKTGEAYANGQAFIVIADS